MSISHFQIPKFACYILPCHKTHKTLWLKTTIVYLAETYNLAAINKACLCSIQHQFQWLDWKIHFQDGSFIHAGKLGVIAGWGSARAVGCDLSPYLYSPLHRLVPKSEDFKITRLKLHHLLWSFIIFENHIVSLPLHHRPAQIQEERTETHLSIWGMS